MTSPPPDPPPGASPGSSAIVPETEIFPETLRGRNRRWLILLMLTPVVMAILGVLALTTSGPPEPSVRPGSVPTGYRAISDAYFGYAVPANWKLDSAYSDANGDSFVGGPGGWIGESLRIRPKAPVPGTDVPAQLATFGQVRPSPIDLGPARPVTVAGADAAYRYDVTRPDGFRATALEVWQGSSQTEAWVLINANPAVTRVILAGFRA